MTDLFDLAIKSASISKDKIRRARIGAAAIRSDGKIVTARNGSAQYKAHSCHAEMRLLRKAGYGAGVFVARVRKDGSTALAKPCSQCEAALRNKRVEYVAYTVGEGRWKIMHFSNNT